MAKEGPHPAAHADLIAVELHSPLSNAVVVTLVSTVAFIFAGYAWRDYAASRAAADGTTEGAQRALRMSPGNARFWHIAAAHSLFGSQDVGTAIQQLATSVRLNPWSADAWLSLANAYLVTGQTERGRLAIESAVDADPRTPDVSWQAGNFYLLEGDTERAAKLFRVVVENDPDKSDRALRLLWASKPDVQFILANAVPPNAENNFSFLNLLCEKGEFEAAQAVWNRIRNLQQPFPSKFAYPFLDFLIKTKRSNEAAAVWDELADKNPGQIAHRGPNLIVNASFEEAISNGGFDWRYTSTRGATISIDPVVAVAGSRSLAIEFDGAPPSAGIEQYVPVAPNTKYHFSVSTMWDDIQSSSGPRIAIDDAYSEKRYAATEDMLENSVWHRQDIDFVSGPDAHLLSIKVIREPWNAAIKGKLWIDDMQLRKD